MRPTITLSEEAESKLRTIMEVHELPSLEAAADFAFTQGENRALLLKDLYANAISDEEWGEAFDPNYDLEKLRAMEVPQPPHNDAAAA